jgi:hypothetical protein
MSYRHRHWLISYGTWALAGIVFGALWYYVFHSLIGRGEARRLLDESDRMLDAIAPLVAVVAAIFSFVGIALLLSLLHWANVRCADLLPVFLRSFAHVHRIVLRIATAFAGANFSWAIIALAGEHSGIGRALGGMAGSAGILAAAVLHPVLWRRIRGRPDKKPLAE